MRPPVPQTRPAFMQRGGGSFRSIVMAGGPRGYYRRSPVYMGDFVGDVEGTISALVELGVELGELLGIGPGYDPANGGELYRQLGPTGTNTFSLPWGQSYVHWIKTYNPFNLWNTGNIWRDDIGIANNSRWHDRYLQLVAAGMPEGTILDQNMVPIGLGAAIAAGAGTSGGGGGSTNTGGDEKPDPEPTPAGGLSSLLPLLLLFALK